MTNDGHTVLGRLRRRAFLRALPGNAAGRKDCSSRCHGNPARTELSYAPWGVGDFDRRPPPGGHTGWWSQRRNCSHRGSPYRPDTLLLERYGFLGGNGTAGLMTCYNGFRKQRPPEALQTGKGIAAEFIAELVRLGGVVDIVNYEMAVPHNVQVGDLPYAVPFDPEAAKIACLDLITKEGVRLRLHSWIVAPMFDGRGVTSVIVHSKPGRQASPRMLLSTGWPASIRLLHFL